jgi:hypothetical protein
MYPSNRKSLCERAPLLSEDFADYAERLYPNQSDTIHETLTKQRETKLHETWFVLFYVPGLAFFRGSYPFGCGKTVLCNKFVGSCFFDKVFSSRLCRLT